mmetsp:Transcript_27544/g.59291  ORF Transcript_27544/g.59291 Transcript_27544/m.59291 type:complete len:82 (-) Transcript_27544:31-276(-)
MSSALPTESGLQADHSVFTLHSLFFLNALLLLFNVQASEQCSPSLRFCLRLPPLPTNACSNCCPSEQKCGALLLVVPDHYC